MKKGMVGVTAAISGAVVGAAITDRLVKTQVAEKQKMSDKHFNLFMMMNKWVRAKTVEVWFPFFKKKVIRKLLYME